MTYISCPYCGANMKATVEKKGTSVVIRMRVHSRRVGDRWRWDKATCPGSGKLVVSTNPIILEKDNVE